MNILKRGEIATVLALGALVVLGALTLVSSTLVRTDKNQTTQTSAAVNCDTDKWYCAGECASSAVRDIFNGTYPPDGSGNWRQEKAANCKIDVSKCATTATCTVPSPTPNCEQGKLNVFGACDPACCANDSQCSGNNPQPQRCNNPNGTCQSGNSCAVVQGGQKDPQFIRKCVNKTCAWTGCTQEEIDKGWCTSSTSNPPAASIKCSTNTECGATPTVTPYKSPTPTPRLPASSPTPVNQQCGTWRSDQCSDGSCGSSKYCENNHAVGKACVCKNYPAATPVPTKTPSPTVTVPIVRLINTLTPTTVLTRVPSPIPTALPNSQPSGRCADSNQLYDCPATYEENGRIVERSCPASNQINTNCVYTCFTTDRKQTIDCWSGQSNPLDLHKALGLEGFDLHIVNMSSNPRTVQAVIVGKRVFKVGLPPVEDVYKDVTNEDFVLQPGESRKVLNDFQCAFIDVNSNRTVEVIYLDGTVVSGILFAKANGLCHKPLIVGIP